jgi:hypothetical protein
VRGRVDAKQLVDDAEGAVAGDVQREQARGADGSVAVDPDERRGEGEVPEQLVEERRVEGRIGEVTLGPVVAVDLERPRQVGGPPERIAAVPRWASRSSATVTSEKSATIASTSPRASSSK